MATRSPISHLGSSLASQATASAQLVGITTAGLQEIWRYASGSRQSQLWQLEALRALDERLRRDVGLAPHVPLRVDAWPGPGW